MDDLEDKTHETGPDQALGKLDWYDFPSLLQARARFTIESKNKEIDVFFRAHITGMVGTLNLYINPELSYTWWEASLIMAKAVGHGIRHAHNLHACVSGHVTSLLSAWGLGLEGFRHWLQLMCCACLYSKSKYFVWTEGQSLRSSKFCGTSEFSTQN